MNKQNVIITIIIASLFIIPSASPIMAYSEKMTKLISPPEQLDKIFNNLQLSPNGWYYKPESYNELVSWYLTLENQFPNYIEVFKANELYNTGKTAGNYDVYYVRITNESLGLHKPEVLYLGSPHGDESAGTIGMYWFVDWLMRKAYTDEPCEEYSKDYLQWIVDNREIYLEVSHNPYGFDYIQRQDSHGWDLNREADYDGPGSPTGGIWGSVPGKTLYKFVNNHTIRVGCDFHAGIRLLIYPWSGTFPGLNEISPITGKTYKNVPPDFFFFDASSLRLGDYMGDFGGDLNKDTVGTTSEHIDYRVKGGMGEWGYAADVVKHPEQDIYVKDEKYGNYNGSGILWVTPEMSYTKNPWEIYMGNDTVDGYGKEVRRFILHQTDLAQPYIRWMGTDNTDEHTTIKTGTAFSVSWQVNGSLVVDHTYIQWGTNIDPVNNYISTTNDYDQYSGKSLGGTGWDHAENGKTTGVTYHENLTFDSPGEYYIVAKAQVDQMYKSTVFPETYGENSYLRLIQERTNKSYHETINGTDGLEEINGNSWWYSSIIKVTVRDNIPPMKPELTGPSLGENNKPYSLTIKSEDPNQDDTYFSIDWGDGEISEWIGPFESGTENTIKHSYEEKGTYLIKAKAKDIFDDESEYSLMPIQMPKTKEIYQFPIIQWFKEQIQLLFNH
ncbi:hypothetical protein B6U98_06020 [Thermoplasmatales archaeon ex4572_165]|nr:MAG: hypothetical protein B6U98_06020 [Thermoplasmatales archaeon ex4572_165]